MAAHNLEMWCASATMTNCRIVSGRETVWKWEQPPCKWSPAREDLLGWLASSSIQKSNSTPHVPLSCWTTQLLKSVQTALHTLGTNIAGWVYKWIEYLSEFCMTSSEWWCKLKPETRKKKLLNLFNNHLHAIHFVWSSHTICSCEAKRKKHTEFIPPLIKSHQKYVQPPKCLKIEVRLRKERD